MWKVMESPSFPNTNGGKGGRNEGGKRQKEGIVDVDVMNAGWGS